MKYLVKIDIENNGYGMTAVLDCDNINCLEIKIERLFGSVAHVQILESWEE